MAASTRWRQVCAGLASGLLGCSLLAAMLPAASADAAESSPPAALPSGGVLSGRLAQLATPALAAAPAGAQARALSMATEGTGSLLRAGDAVLVQVRLSDTGAATVQSLATVGALVNVSPAMSRATMLVTPDRLHALAALPEVQYADVVPAPITGRGAAVPRPQVAATARATASRRCNPITSEADTQLRAATARHAFDVDGTGVTVGVLSDSYDVDPGAATFAYDDVRSGDLPGPGNPCGRTDPVRVVAEFTPDGSAPTDEGRAMLQGVHDLAPGARLAFATASAGPDAFAANIRALRRSGADVIVDDITYLTEPFFQAGVIENAVASVVRKGAVYLSSAGNSNVVLGGRDVSSWETPATRLAPCPDLDVDPGYGALGQCVSFSPTSTDTGYDLTVAPGGSITPVLQWAEPVGGVTDDFDLFVVAAGSGEILEQSTARQGDSQSPVEYLTWHNNTSQTVQVRIVVNRFAGSGTPRLKLAFATSFGIQAVQYDRSQGGDVVGPTVFGHNGGADTVSVAAVPYSDATSVEPYSARGPVTRYFGPVTGLTPAAALARPQVIGAPQVAATDGTANTFFGDTFGGVHRFYGTSAAAPAAAAVAALMRQLNPRLSDGQVRSAMRRTADPVGTAPASAVGGGLVDAREALALVAPPPAPVVTRTQPRRRAARVSFRYVAASGAAATTGFAATCTGTTVGDVHSVSRAGTSGAPLVVTGLSRGKPYSCRVRARTEFGLGASSAAGRTVVARGRPSRPSHVHVAPLRHAVVVSFRAAKNTGGRRLTGFTATCTPIGPGTARSRSGDGTTLRVRRLDPGSRYRCVVVARNRLGHSRPSHRSAAVRPRV